MSKDNSRNLPDQDADASAPKGAEVVSADRDRSPELDALLLEKVEEKARLVAVSTVQHEAHSGPMPSPKQLKAYEEILPGTAQVIRDEFQANSAHIRKMEGLALEAHRADNLANRKVAERLIWGALGATVLLAILGHYWVAACIAVSTVGAVVTGFLQQKVDRREPSERREEVQSEE